MKFNSWDFMRIVNEASTIYMAAVARARGPARGRDRVTDLKPCTPK